MPGGTFFFTVVAYKRQPILTKLKCMDILREVINKVKQQYPFTIDGWVLLPDHIHAIWSLPEYDNDFSKRWGLIKAGFSKKAKNLLHRNEWMTDAKRKYRETTIWQRRFWEHMIRDEKDFNTHMDYIYFNPVKYGLVKCVKDWPYSTFHKCVKKGFYEEDWGGDGIENKDGKSFGE